MSSITPVSTGAPLQSLRAPPPPPAKVPDTDGDNDGGKASQANSSGVSRALDLRV